MHAEHAHGLLRVNRTGLIIDADQAAADLLGERISSVIGRQADQLADGRAGVEYGPAAGDGFAFAVVYAIGTPAPRPPDAPSGDEIEEEQRLATEQRRRVLEQDRTAVEEEWAAIEAARAEIETARAEIAREREANASERAALAAERAELESEREHVAAREAVAEDDAVIVSRPDGTIIEWSYAAELLYWWKPEEAIGASLDGLILGPSRAGEQARLARVAAGEELPPYPTRRVRKDGWVFDVLVRLAPVRDESGDVVAIASHCRELRRAPVALAAAG